MRFVFTRLFYVLLTAGFVPLSLSWQRPGLRWATIFYDGALLVAAFVDSRLSRWPRGVKVEREFGGRFAVGAETEVRLKVTNNSLRPVTLTLKDEYPPQMKLRDPREARLRVAPQTSAALVSRRSLTRT